MLRISATYSCYQWYSHGFVKYFNPVVPHTPKRKQQRDHFRWNQCSVSVSLIFTLNSECQCFWHLLWLYLFRCHKTSICPRATWRWTLFASWNRCWWWNCRSKDSWACRPWFVWMNILDEEYYLYVSVIAWCIVFIIASRCWIGGICGDTRKETWNWVQCMITHPLPLWHYFCTYAMSFFWNLYSYVSDK